MKHSPQEDSSGSDDEGSEAPQSVSFGRSRNEALESIAEALKETRRLKERKKEKQRIRHALLRQQKKNKIDLSSAKLPESVLEGLSVLDSQLEPKATEDLSKSRTMTEDKLESPDEEDDDEEDDDAEENEREDDEDGQLLSDGEEYLNLGGFHAVALSEERHKPPPTKETALEFLNNHLYGSRIHRESVNKHISRLRKKNHKPALHFTKSGTKKRSRRRRKTKGRNWQSLLQQ